jgi:hypothetical protein
MLNTVTKGEFAKMVNLSPGRVSQMISEGKLSDCLVGEGREARIDAAKAIEKLKLRRDPGQALGNGAKATLSVPPPAPPVTPAAPSVSDDISLKLQRAKLEEAEFRNRKLREEERAREGTYVRAEDVKAETAKLATRLLQLFEGGLTDVATEIAATFKVPQRDVLHLLKKRFRDVRTNVSAEIAAEAAALPAAIEETDPINA